MNTHFALAAIYGLGLRGIENKTKLPYGPIGSPGVTRETLVKLPTSLDAATATFARKGSIAREVLGDFFVDHYAGTREHELDLHRKAVTNWECKYTAVGTFTDLSQWNVTSSLRRRGSQGLLAWSSCQQIYFIVACREWGISVYLVQVISQGQMIML